MRVNVESVKGLFDEDLMGGHPWFYCVPYEKDLAKCLEKLRWREFAAGRYNPAEAFRLMTTCGTGGVATTPAAGTLSPKAISISP